MNVFKVGDKVAWNNIMGFTIGVVNDIIIDAETHDYNISINIFEVNNNVFDEGKTIILTSKNVLELELKKILLN